MADPPDSADSVLHSTARLLARVRDGEAAARDEILARYLPALRRWAHGRLPRAARDLFDTDDLVQTTMIRTLSHLEAFDPKFEGAFLAYLRRGILNQIRDQVRRVRRAPERVEMPEHLVAREATPLEQAVGRDLVERFERALEALPPAQQEAVLMRLELGFSYRQIADAIGAPSEDAARKVVARALVKLAEIIGENDDAR